MMAEESARSQYQSVDDSLQGEADTRLDLHGLLKPKIKRVIQEKLSNVKDKLNAKRKDAIKMIHEEPIHLKNKISFVLGVVTVIMTPYVLGAFPLYFPLLYTLMVTLLILFRWVYYYFIDWHYFMFDFCYFANGLMLLYVWYFNESGALFAICFSFANGPLLWSIPAFRNSMVFHEIDKITSVFIHLAPPILTYCLRWKFRHDFAIEVKPTLINFVLIPLVPYLLWQALYYLKVYWNVRTFNGKMTTAKYLLENKFVRKACSLPFGEERVHYGFMLYQFLYMLLSLFPTLFLYKWRLLHAGFIIFFALIGIWNGATYYFEVFVKRYDEELRRQMDMLKEFESVAGILRDSMN